MDLIHSVVRFIMRIRWWVIIAPLIIVSIVLYKTRQMPRTYNVDMTIYTGVISGYVSEMGEGVNQNTNVINNTLDNIINIVSSKETLKGVSLLLYAQHMIHGDAEKDNEYIQAANFRKLQEITPPDVKKLIDKSSLTRTVENLKSYEKASPSNFVYGLFNWYHPHYSYDALKNIKVSRIGNSDMLTVYYAANDPGVAYQTLILLDSVYVKEYKVLQYGSTNSAIRYFEEELARVGVELKENEDALTQYNVENRIINYDDQTKEVAALDKEFELAYQDVLMRYNSANASIKYLESQIDENVKHLKTNSEFLAKLNQISQLSTKISELESFYPDTTASVNNQKKITTYKNQLGQIQSDLNNLTSDQGAKKYTKDGYPTSNFVSLWVEQLLVYEKAKSEMQVMEDRKERMDAQYSHFSPIGSTIKRKERSIDFTERNYLSILTGLNAARLRLKGLEMNSAALKVINPPTFPLGAEPMKRKQIVLGSYLASVLFIIGFFLIIELLDRTLRDPLRVKRLTSANTLGAFPAKGKLRLRKHVKVYIEKATQHLANTLSNYVGGADYPRVINFIGTNDKAGKSFIIQHLSDYWIAKGLSVTVVNYDKDFDPSSKEYIFAQSIADLVASCDSDIILVEHAPLNQYAVNKSILQEACMNILVAPANKVWTENDQKQFRQLEKLVDDTPLFFYLNYADKSVVEGFTGMLPPYSVLRKFLYQYSQMGLTSVSLK